MSIVTEIFSVDSASLDAWFDKRFANKTQEEIELRSIVWRLDEIFTADIREEVVFPPIAAGIAALPCRHLVIAALAFRRYSLV